MSGGQEHRQARAELRVALSGEWGLQSETLEHLLECTDCRDAIQQAIDNNPNTTYGQTVDETLQTVRPKRSSWSWRM